jgi:5-methylcytosine-specific restriction enzyme A
VRVPCRHPGCHNLLDRAGYCEQHKTSQPDRRKDYDANTRAKNPALRDAARIRSSARWKKVSRLKLSINPICEDPLGHHGSNTQTATQVHHIEAVAKRPELAFDLANLMAVCTYCHPRIEGLTKDEMTPGGVKV